MPINKLLSSTVDESHLLFINNSFIRGLLFESETKPLRAGR